MGGPSPQSHAMAPRLVAPLGHLPFFHHSSAITSPVELVSGDPSLVGAMVRTSDIEEEEQVPNEAEVSSAGGLVGAETRPEAVDRTEGGERVGEEAGIGAMFEQVMEAMLRRIQTAKSRVDEEVERGDGNSIKEKEAQEPAAPNEQEQECPSEKDGEQEESDGEDSESVDLGNLLELPVGGLNASNIEAMGTETELDKAVLRLRQNDPFLLTIE